MNESEGPTPAVEPGTITIQPSSAHTHAIILLHGLGSNGEKFGTEFLETGVSSSGKRLPEIYPSARFIFPTAKKRRSSAFRRARLNQWFDIASLDDPSHRRDLQLQGLAESALEIREIIKQELTNLPSRNIILGGLSQGCAMSLFVLLTLDFPLGGFVGMSGWLPFRGDIDEMIDPGRTPAGDDGDGDDDDDPFAVDASEEEELDPILAATNFARDLLSVEALDASVSKITQTSLTTPVFLGHGEDDEKIKVTLGRDAAQTLTSLGMQTTWKSYQETGHWYKIPDEIDDILNFLQPKLSQDANDGKASV